MSVRKRALALLGCFFPVLASAMGAVTAESAIVIDAETGKVMWEKDAYSRRFPASTTKIMTALLLLEHAKLSDVVTAPATVETVPGSSLYLKPLETLTVEDLVYALMIRSANDGAYAAAVHVAGSQRRFAQMMTERAKALGCKDTNFVNPHGLHHRDHYTTAADLAIIAREAMKNETFARVVGTEYRFIERSKNSEDLLLVTRNSFLKDHDYATGIKTGWTNPAGRCFVGSAERDGLKLITVVLRSTDWKGDTDVIADWAFANWTAEPVIAKDEVIASVPVKGGDRVSVPLAAVQDYAVARPRDGAASYQIVETSVEVALPVTAGQRVGSVTFRDQDGADHTMDVYAAASVSPAPLVLSGSPGGLFGVVALLAMVGGAWFFRRRALRI